MRRSARTRLASLAVLVLVLVTGFLLGMAWDRRERVLEARGLSEISAPPAQEGDASSEGAGPTARPEESGAETSGEDPRDDDGRERRRESRSLLVYRVGISPEQRTRVDSIVEVHGQRVRELRREMRASWTQLEAAYDPRFRALLTETRTAIRSQLSQEQAVRYDSLLAEHDRREADEERRNDR